MIALKTEGLNNFQSMPVLPGASAPAAILSGSAKSRKGGKGAGSGKGRGGRGKGRTDADDDDGQPKPVSKKDEELYQIDLMRRQVLLRSTSVSCIFTYVLKLLYCIFVFSLFGIQIYF